MRFGSAVSASVFYSYSSCPLVCVSGVVKLLCDLCSVAIGIK